MIVAANKEVLDNRAPGNALSSKDLKQFDPTNFSVSWKPDVYDFYRSRPAQFARENPNLRLGAAPISAKPAPASSIKACSIC